MDEGRRVSTHALDAVRTAYYSSSACTRSSERPRVIRSFRSKKTQWLFEGGHPQEFRSFETQAERKLLMLEAAVKLSDLRAPPGNRLEALSGPRRGQHSIRINDQYRICFQWSNLGPNQVEIVDYH